jgi:hypothetical protein
VFDFANERARHRGFVGRSELLSQLDHLLLAEEPDRWVVITGGPGMGKSALLTAWLERRLAAGDDVPHHFIRRGQYHWDDPAKLVGSLAQISASPRALDVAVSASPWQAIPKGVSAVR